MPSQLNASAHYSIGFKQASFKPVKLPISGEPKDALSFFTQANSSLADFKPRKLALPANFNEVVHIVCELDNSFEVECYGQLKELGGEDKHGLCIYIVTNKETDEKHGLIGFAGQGLSNFNGSNTRTYCKYTVCLFGEDADFKSVELRNPCSELGFQLAKAVSVYAAFHRRNKGEFCSFMDFNAIQKVLQSKSPKEAKLATNGTNMPIQKEEFDEVMGPWQDIAPAVMLRCLINKCGDLEFFGLIETLFNRCVELGVAPDNIRWAEIDPFGDAHWGVGLQSEKTCSILETAAVHLAKHGVDNFPGKNLMGQCLSDLVVLVRDPATGEFCDENDLDEIFESVDQEPFIQLVPRDVWTGDYFPKPAAADVGTSLHLPLQSDEEPDHGSQAALSWPESSLWRPVTPDYDPNSPNYVPTSPTDARQDEIKAERIASATRRVRDLVPAFVARTSYATAEGADFDYQQRLIEDVEEFLAELKEACPVAAKLMEDERKQKLEKEMQAPDEEASTTIGREIAMQLADELPGAVRMAMRPRACVEYKDEVIKIAEDLVKAVKMTHPYLADGDILSDSDEEDRPAKRARQGSDDSYGRPASTSRVLSASPIHAADLEELANEPSSQEETPVEQHKALKKVQKVDLDEIARRRRIRELGCNHGELARIFGDF